MKQIGGATYLNTFQYHCPRRWLIHNIPIFKNVTKNNLTNIFKATKMEVFKNWLSKTRPNELLLKRFPATEIQALEVDKVLSRLKGTLYDVRDFVNGGFYHPSKINLYMSFKNTHRKEKAISDVVSRRVMDRKPFLSKESISDVHFVVSNGSVYIDEPNSDAEVNAKGPLDVNHEDDTVSTDIGLRDPDATNI